ncbi:MAG TPA: glycosyltransferase family 39 protein [Caldilineaceae bacterium]|nr:glycosyltransferase family 39 protein [Caldilineaceae bacterium]
MAAPLSLPQSARRVLVWQRLAGPWPDVAIVLLGLAVRLWRLDYHSIWFDEAVSLRWAGSDLGFIWQKTFPLVEEKHPPVYYSVLHLWQQGLALIGLDQSDVALRVLGSLLGALTVWGILRLAASTGTRAAGRLAGLLVALSPLLVWYSQELRMFQPAATAIVWFAYALWRGWTGERAAHRLLWWSVAVVAIEAALYSYLFSAFVLPAAGLTLAALLWRERRWGRFAEGAAALAVAGLLFLPLARNAWSVNRAEGTPGRAFANFSDNLLRLLQTDTIWRVDWPDAARLAALAFFGVLVIIGLVWPWPRPAASARVDRLWLALWLGAPLLIANLLLSRSGSIFAEDRYLLFLAPFTLWAIGRGCAALLASIRPIGLGAGCVAAGLLLAALPPLWTPARARENWRAAADYIVDYQQASPGLPGAAVAHVEYTREPLEWYVRQRMSFAQLPIFFPFGAALRAEEVEQVVAPPLNGIVELGAATLWLTQSHLEGVDDARLVEGWLATRFPLITEQYPAGIKLTGYMLQAKFKSLPLLGPSAVYPAAELASGLRLAACEIITPEVAAEDQMMHPPSGWVHLRLWWEATQPLAHDYVATAQMVGPEGVWGDRLHRPTETLRLWPTSTWTPGEFVRDEIDVNLNPVTPPGTYPIIVGLADAGGQPLPHTAECGQVRIVAGD